MANNFLCTYCKGYLNVSDYIVLTVRKKKGGRGLIFLSPQLGDYKKIHNPAFTFKSGEILDFYCPICGENLVATELDERLAKVLMTDENQNVYQIFFSGIAEEKCTYKLKDTQVEAYGDNKRKYMNYFGETRKY